jgi:intraflagellar transport protein 122
VVIYNASDGEVIQALRAHAGSVYCIAYSADGKFFASGDSEKSVIIWTSQGEAVRKYGHSSSIQCLAFNPMTGLLCSGTHSDFGLMPPEQRSVSKHRVPARILSCAWSADGQHLALGLMNGQVSIRDREGEEKARIERTQPVWTLAWTPAGMEGGDLLAVGCWDQTLSFYQAAGRQVGRDRPLGYDPCSLSYMGTDYIVIGGTDKKVPSLALLLSSAR